MSLKNISNGAFSVKIDFNYFYATFKQWSQEVKRPHMYFSLIICIPNFYDMYIMYSK
jgi:hypothetical protein